MNPIKQSDKTTSANTQIQLPNSANPTTAIIPKTAGYVKTIFSKLGQGVYNGLYHITDGVTYYTGLQAGARNVGYYLGYGGLVTVQHAVFTTGSLPAIKEEALERLNTITGCEEFGLFLSNITPFIAENIRPGLLKKIPEKIFKNKFVKDFLDKKESFLADLITTLLAKMMVNIGDCIRKKRATTNDDRPVTPVDIIAYLMETTALALKNVQSELAKSDAIPDQIARKAALKKAIAPAIKEILALVLPKGIEEILLRLVIRGKAWTYLEKEVLPDYLIAFAGYMRGFESITHVENWQNDPANAFLARAGKEISTVITKWGSGLVADPQIAYAISDRIVGHTIPGHSEVQIQLKMWLTEQIKLIGASYNPAINVFWNYLGGSVEALIANGAMSLSKTDPTNTLVREGDEALIVIFLNLMHAIHCFVVSKEKAITESYSKLMRAGKKPEEDSNYIQHFVPLSMAFQQMMGISSKKGQMPAYLENLIQSTFNTHLPAFLAKHYRKHLHLLSDAYEAMKEVLSTNKQKINSPLVLLDELPGAQGLAVKSRQLGLYVKNDLKSRIPQPGQLAEMAATGVAEAAPHLKEALRSMTIQCLLGTDTKVLPITQDDQLTRQVFDLKEWIRNWVKDHAETFATTHDSRVVNLWHFIQTGVGNILAHVVMGHADNGVPAQLIPSVIADKLITHFDHFFNRFGNAIFRRYRELKALNIQPDTDAEFVTFFKPLCDDLLALTGLGGEAISDKSSLPVSKLIDFTLRWFASEKAPKLLASLYSENLTPFELIDEYENRLKKLLEMENEQFIQIDNIIDLISQKTAKILHKSFHQQIAKKIDNGTLPKNSDAILTPNTYLQIIIKSLLIEAFTNNCEQQRKLGPISLSNLLKSWSALIVEHRKRYLWHMQTAASMDNPEDRQMALRQTFYPLAKMLLNSLRSPTSAKTTGFPVHMPFADLLEQKGVWETIEKEVLPDLLGSMYMDTSAFTRLAKDNRLELGKRMETPHLPESCHAFAEWVSEFLPPFLYMKRLDLSESIYSVIKNALNTSGNPQGLSVAAYLERNEAVLKKQICQDLFSNLKRGSPLLPLAQPAIKEHVEAILLNSCNKITKHIDDLENPKGEHYQHNFLLNTGIRMLNTIKDHFHSLNATAKEIGKSALHHLSYDEALKGLDKRKQLHLGIVKKDKWNEAVTARSSINEALATLRKERKLLAKLNPKHDKRKIARCKKAIQTAKDKLKQAKQIESIHRAEFFKPLANEIMHLSGIDSADDLPFPSPLKEQLWDQIHKELMPNIFASAFEAMMEPSKRNTMLINSLHALNETWDTLDAEDEMQMQLRYASEASEKLESALLVTEKTAHPADQRMQKIQIENAFNALDQAVKAIERWERHAQNETIKNHFITIQDGLQRVNEALSIIFPVNPTKPVAPSKGIAATLEMQQSLAQAYEMARTGLVSIKHTLTVIPQLTATVDKEREEDETQAALNKACGELVLELAGVLGKSVIKTAFKFKRVQTMTAEKIGRALRRQLAKKWTLLQMIDKGASTGMPNLFKGSQWNKDGKFVRTGQPNDVDFAETDEELEHQELERIEYTEKTYKEVRSKMIASARRLVVDNINGYLKAPFLWLKTIWDAAVNKVFGKYSSDVREFFSWIGRITMLRFIELGLAFIGKHIAEAFWYFPEIYLGAKADHLLQSLQHDIHDNLLYRLSDELIASLKGQPTDMQAVLNPLLAAAQQHDDQELSEVAAYRKKWKAKAMEG